MRLRFLILLILIAFGKYSIAQLPNIVAVEYFFNTDPGFGNGTQVAIIPNSLIDVTFEADFSSLPDGFHTLLIRTQDENGKWCITFTKEVFKFTIPAVINNTPLSNIVAMEYFFNVDPGFGNGTPIPVASGIYTEVSFNADFGSLPDGFHNLMVRAQDESGKWSIAFTEEIFKFTSPVATNIDPLSDIIAMEYFFNVDPGFGNGIQISVTPGQSTDVTFNADLSSLPDGFHILMVRSQDETGKWNIAFTEEVFKFTPPGITNLAPLPNIIAMEYFFDPDPGFGNGVQVPVSPGILTDITFNADFSSLRDGFHNLMVRTQNETGNWSIVYSDEVFKFTPPVATNLSLLPNIVAMEYYFDVDPGFGNGISMPISNGPLVDIVFIPEYNTLSTAGEHQFCVRVKDDLDNWSLLFVDTITVSILANFDVSETVLYTGDTTYFSDLSISSDIINSWFWDFGDGTTSSIQNPSHIYTIPGSYTVSLIVNDTINSDTLEMVNYIIVNPTPLLVGSTSLNNDCYGGTLGSIDLSTTSGSPPFSYIWSNGESIEDISNLSAGTYYVTVMDLYLMHNETFIITEPSEIEANPQITHVSVTGANDGEIELSVSGGIAPYSYNWTSGELTDSILNLSPGYYSVNISDSNFCEKIDSFLILTHDNQTINLIQNWEIYSTYIIPYSPSVVDVVSPVVTNIQIVKDENGQVYWPAFGVNMIGNTILGKGYQIKMIMADTLLISGFYKEPELHFMVIPSGWSILGYLRKTPSDVVGLLSQIATDVILVKNGAGQVYWPAFGVNMIGNMIPGKGYQIKMGLAQPFIFPAN